MSRYKVNQTTGELEKLIAGKSQADIDGAISDLIALTEVSPSASAYAVDDYLIYDGKLRKVIADIAVGDTLVEGTNIEQTTMMKALKTSGGGCGINGEAAMVTIPTVSVGEYTYNGTPQGPTITNLDTTRVNVITGKVINAGTQNMVLTLKNPLTMVWEDGTNTPKAYQYTIGKAAGDITLSKNVVNLIPQRESDTVTISDATGPITISADSTTIITLSHESMDAPGGTLTVESPTSKTGTATITVSVAESDNYLSTSTTITANGIFTYGVTWDGTSSPLWTRSGVSEEFTAPVAAVDNGNGSSPFDNLLPWSGMQIVEDSIAGTLVSIPKYYYKWSKSDTAMTLQISASPQTGFYVSPAHADRGDGQGERDVVYVGRYHCSSIDYKSTSGVLPKTNEAKATFRTNIHNLGSEYWQYDFAMYWTIMMLYLVEFASWNSQENIGYGCSNNGAKEDSGFTDDMTYHTGTNAASLKTYGHVQYRHIEDLWANVHDWCDGIYFGSTDNKTVYIIRKPGSFSDSSNGSSVGIRCYSSANYDHAKALFIPSSSTYNWAVFPSEATNSGSYSEYMCDTYAYTPKTDGSSVTYNTALYIGGSYYKTRDSGAFKFCGHYGPTQLSDYVGGRLMKLPNNS